MKKLTLYSAQTPNGFPISMLLEELSIPYDLVKMSIMDKDIGKVHNQVKSPWFVEGVNPNGRIPAITLPKEKEGGEMMSIFETSAILLWLVEKFDGEKRFGYDSTKEGEEWIGMMQWLFFAHGGIGPMQGQANHFVLFAPEKIPHAMTRYLNETRRLYSVLEGQLSKHEYIAGDKYTIADIKAFPWVRRSDMLKIDLKEFPKVKAWVDRIAERPATIKAYKSYN